jgi:hypothetical protein
VISRDAYTEFLRNRAALDFYERKFPLLRFSPMAVQTDFISSPAKVSVFSAGNRAGKTESGAFKAAALANGILGRFYPGFPDKGEPTRGWVSTLDYKLADVVKRKLQKMLGVTIRRWYEKDQTFLLHNGSEIIIKSEESGEQKYQAEDVHWAWKDEAGDSRAEGIFHEILRALTDHDGPVFITMTPTLGTSWIGPRLYEPWNAVAADKNGVIVNGTAFFFGNTEDNIHLSRSGLKSFISQQITEEQKAVRLRGRFVTLEGLVFPMFSESRHVIDPVPMGKDWPRYRGMDFGLDAPSTCEFLAVEPPTPKDPEKFHECPCPPHLKPHAKPRLHLYDEVYDDRRGHTIYMTCKSIKERSGEQRFVRTVLDPACWAEEAGPESIGGHFVVAHEYERQGIFADKANHDFEPSLERLWTWLGHPGEQPQLLIHRSCSKVIQEIRGLKWKRIAGNLLGAGPKGGMADRVDANCPKHGIDGLRYVAMCDPIAGGYPMMGPDEDPFPYKELDPLTDEPIEGDDPYHLLYG